MLRGLMHDWEITSVGIHGWKSWDQGAYLLSSKDGCQVVALCVFRLSPTESSASKVHLE